MKTTSRGTPYFDAPEVALVSKPMDTIHSIRVQQYLRELDPSFSDYLLDSRSNLTDGEFLTKFMGQLDYQSFGPGRTLNANAAKYFQHIKEEAHGQILEHSNYGFLCWGVSRSCSHEIVRHRAGFAYSQTSQRYVTRVRFVERPEIVKNDDLHKEFLSRIDRTLDEYLYNLAALESRYPKQEGETKTDHNKRIRQMARSVLPNETETTIAITANVRSWRHFLEQRASKYAETEIRALAMQIYYLLMTEVPMLFSDYEIVYLPDGTESLTTNLRKV